MNIPLFTRIANLFSPYYCGLCGQTSARMICPSCSSDFFSKHPTRCESCALALMPNETALRCGTCLKKPPHFDRSYVCADYAVPIDQLVTRLKFQAQIGYANLLGQQLASILATLAPPDLPDLFCVVPLGRQRLIERGFNQSVEIARCLQRHSPQAIRLEIDLLRRQRDTAPQSSLARDLRLKNVRDAFVPHPQQFTLLRDAHVGIIDDVLTTGATLNEIARVCKRYGAKRVSNFVYARTPASV